MEKSYLVYMTQDFSLLGQLHGQLFETNHPSIRIQESLVSRLPLPHNDQPTLKILGMWKIGCQVATCF